MCEMAAIHSGCVEIPRLQDVEAELEGKNSRYEYK